MTSEPLRRIKSGLISFTHKFSTLTTST